MGRSRVVFFTNSTSQFSLPVLRSMVEDDRFDVCRVIFYDTVAASRGRLLAIVRQHGVRKTIAKVSGLAMNRVSSRLKRRQSKIDDAKYTRQYADSARIPYSIVESANDPDVVRLVREHDADFLVASSFNQILDAPMLQSPRLGAINIHLSLLPKYRGPAPAFWALYHGESETGVTFHYMDRGIDDGDVIAKRTLSIDSQWDELELTNELFDLASRHVCDVLEDAYSKRGRRQGQDEGAASYFTFPTPAQRRELAAARSRGRLTN